MSAINRIYPSDIESFAKRPHMDDYQQIAGKSVVYPGTGTLVGLWYCITKLNGEAGEAAEHIGKAFRDDGALLQESEISDDYFVAGVLTEERKLALVKELGDVLWYTARAAGELGFTLSGIATVNLRKLSDRTERDTLRGSGDER